MGEFEMMKNDPDALFNYYLELMQSGHPLDDDQIVKMEYLKKILIREV